jgi:hypothetical protein
MRAIIGGDAGIVFQMRVIADHGVEAKTAAHLANDHLFFWLDFHG